MTNKEYIAQRVTRIAPVPRASSVPRPINTPAITIAHISPLKKSLATGP